MDKELIMVVALCALTFLFILPSWAPVEPSLEVQASGDDRSVNFTADFSTPWTKSSYLIVYGPFLYDTPGHEEGNNIYVLDRNQGRVSDTLRLKANETIQTLRLELWDDNEKLKAVEVPI